jgi:hypothetical protein
MKSNLKKILIAGAGMLGLATAFNKVTEATHATAQATKEAFDELQKNPALLPEEPKYRIGNRGFGFPAFYSTPSHSVIPSHRLNQRQYRKLERQNPSLRRSKKHRSKN